MKRKITKEHRLLDDTDLNNINNTFRLIEKTCESMNNHMNSLEKSTNTRIDSLEKSMDDKHKTLVVLISGIGIGLASLKIFY
jgi:hypothetical protein